LIISPACPRKQGDYLANVKEELGRVLMLKLLHLLNQMASPFMSQTL